MKLIKINIVLLAFCMFFTSCESFVEIAPKSSLTAADFWKSEIDAEAGVSAMYYSFSKAMSSGNYNWGEVRGGNYVGDQRFGPDQYDIANNSMSTLNSAASWENIYQTINRANLGLKYIPDMSINATAKNNYIGECFAMRALSYFYAVRVWGDVPLFTQSVETYNADIYKTRTDKDLILKQILDDLQQAELYLQPTTSSSFKRTRLTQMSLYAIEMDVYAWMHNYEMVDKIMTGKIRVLSPENSTTSYWGLQTIAPTASTQVFSDSWRSIFIEVPAATLASISKEQIFTIAYNQLENGTNVNIDYFCTPATKLNPSSDLLSAYVADDKRYAATFLNGKPSNKFWATGTSFSGTAKPSSDNDLIIYRMSDLVLLEAEALANLDRMNDAVTQLNYIHTRAGLPAYTVTDFISPDELILAILKERRLELLGEGKYWFDLLRTGHARDLGGITDARFYLFPISKTQMDQNPSLLQNPGYN